MSNEEIIWNAKPSAFLYWPRFIFYPLIGFSWVLLPENIKSFVFFDVVSFKQIASAMSILIVLPLIIAWIGLKCTRYKLTDERLIIYSGILARNREVIELYRVKDFNVQIPFYLRIFSRNNIIIHTSDKTAPVVKLGAIKRGYEVEDVIRGKVEKMRRIKGVREFD